MLIGELSQKTKVSRDAIRMYERRGLIESTRQDNGYRTFASHTGDIILMIREAQSLGFSLRELSEIVPTAVSTGMNADELRNLLLQKAADMEQRIVGLTAMLGHLRKRIDASCPIRSSMPAVKIKR